MLSSIAAGCVSLLTAGVGMAVALGVLSGTVQQEVVGFGTSAIALAFLIANSIIHHGVTTGSAAGVAAARVERHF